MLISKNLLVFLLLIPQVREQDVHLLTVPLISGNIYGVMKTHCDFCVFVLLGCGCCRMLETPGYLFFCFAFHHLQYQLGSVTLAHSFLNPHSMLHMLMLHVYTREGCKTTPHSLIGFLCYLSVSLTVMHISSVICLTDHLPIFPLDISHCVCLGGICLAD